MALDAAKSGRKPIPNRVLLKGKRPHYMASENAVVSNSVVGKLFDIVKGIVNKCSALPMQMVIEVLLFRCWSDYQPQWSA